MATVIPLSPKSTPVKQQPTDQPLTAGDIEKHLRQCFESIIDFCLAEESLFFVFEKELWRQISLLGCLFCQLYLASRHERLDYSKWLDSGRFYVRRETPIGRNFKTIFGEVRYWRIYFIRKGSKKGGCFPFDGVLGLSRDGFSPFVMGLAAKLATRVSFETCVLLFEAFYDWSPSKETIQRLVLGIGRDAGYYMELVDPPKDDGEVLIIEVDGKAIATVTEQELAKRKESRKGQKVSCCQRHRGKNHRKNNKRKRRKKGDHSKNGRSATLVVMYTLKRGEDGLLHGPINKKVWASYAPRKVMLEWARRQATKRGFPPDTDKRIHIGVDGEKCLKEGLSKLFPNATFFLDVRHVEEYLWKVGHAYYPKDAEAATALVEVLRSKLYEGEERHLVELLEEIKDELSPTAKRDEAARKTLTTAIDYMKSRLEMMGYKKYIEDDLPIATGVVEGAARYVIGERMDCSGMRWKPERAEALLHLRCIELNRDWDHFYGWSYDRWVKRINEEEIVVQVGSDEPLKFEEAA